MDEGMCPIVWTPSLAYSANNAISHEDALLKCYGATKIHPRLTGGSRGCATFRFSHRLYRRWTVGGTNGNGSWMLPLHVVARGVRSGRRSTTSSGRVCSMLRGATWSLLYSQSYLQSTYRTRCLSAELVHNPDE